MTGAEGDETVAEFIAAEIPRAGDTTTRDGWVIRNWGRFTWDGTRIDPPSAHDEPAAHP